MLSLQGEMPCGSCKAPAAEVASRRACDVRTRVGIGATIENRPPEPGGSRRTVVRCRSRFRHGSLRGAMSMRITWVAGTLALCAAPAMAQFNVRGCEYQNQTSTRLVAAPASASRDTEEKDYAVGDFNRDGWTDLVVVRKQPFTTPGKRARRPVHERERRADRPHVAVRVCLGRAGRPGPDDSPPTTATWWWRTSTTTAGRTSRPRSRSATATRSTSPTRAST